ncbi:MAG TPA: divalent metal cation transporter [Nitrososphaeraceae archaeon]|nr:divalent metal cation transporter [Nitrososphaeraceae archaeon]
MADGEDSGSASEIGDRGTNGKAEYKEKKRSWHHYRNARSSQEHLKSKTSVIESLKSLGPGIITGASDDDPSGIATFSQAGAQFGFGMLWMALFQYPMMTIVQEICARIGLVTGDGLGGVLKKKYSKKLCFHLQVFCLLQIQ